MTFELHFIKHVLKAIKISGMTLLHLNNNHISLQEVVLLLVQSTRTTSNKTEVINSNHNSPLVQTCQIKIKKKKNTKTPPITLMVGKVLKDYLVWLDLTIENLQMLVSI